MPGNPSTGQPNTQPTAAVATETYTHGYSAEHRRFLAMRSAATEAAFFVPYLRPGMRVIDCGCGQGSITVGLAEAIAPGEVIGIDREPTQVEAARTGAAERGVSNVRFQVGDIYDLPFPDASFDAAFAHTVLEHLSEPPRAIAEMRRVLKAGGVIGIRDPDYATSLLEPATPLVREALDLYERVSVHNGSSPHYARHLRQLLREAGFSRTEASSSTVGSGVDATAPMIFELALKPWFQDPAFVKVSIVQGWADQARLDAMLEAVQAWSHSPVAFFSMTLCAAVGWLSESPA